MKKESLVPVNSWLSQELNACRCAAVKGAVFSGSGGVMRALLLPLPAASSSAGCVFFGTHPTARFVPETGKREKRPWLFQWDVQDLPSGAKRQDKEGELVRNGETWEGVGQEGTAGALQNLSENTRSREEVMWGCMRDHEPASWAHPRVSRGCGPEPCTGLGDGCSG